MAGVVEGYRASSDVIPLSRTARSRSVISTRNRGAGRATKDGLGSIWVDERTIAAASVGYKEREAAELKNRE